MFDDLYPHRTFTIRWLAFCDRNGRSRVRDFLDALPETRRRLLNGQMQAFADMGWSARAPFLKTMQTTSPHTIYEIKRHQERVLFVRCSNAAVAIDALTKKNDWSKKDANRLGAALRLADAAIDAWKLGGWK